MHLELGGDFWGLRFVRIMKYLIDSDLGEDQQLLERENPLGSICRLF